MTYWNPVLRWGVDAFARDLASAGGLGLITPDLIPDEAEEWLAVSDAMTWTGLSGGAVVNARAAGRDGQGLTGFVYAASTMGVTGRATRSRWPRPNWCSGSRRCRTFRSVSGWVCARASRRPRSATSADGVIVGSAWSRR